MDSGRLESGPNGAVHLDTVRALHQTVVSLRTALEVSKNELRELKEKYEEHSRCTDYADVIEKLTLENHILRRRIIDSDHDGGDPNTQNIKLAVTYSPRTQNIDDFGSEVIIKTATTDFEATADLGGDYPEFQETVTFCSSDRLNDLAEDKEKSDSPEESLGESRDILSDIRESASEPRDSVSEARESDSIVSSVNGSQDIQLDPIQSQVASLSKEPEDTQPSFKTKLELLSKFDVRIKVRTVKEGVVLSSSTSDSDTSTEKKERERTDDSRASFHFEEKREHFENVEDPKGTQVNVKTVSGESIKMAVPSETEAKGKGEKFDVQVRITSEENLVVKETIERNRRKDTLNLDVDDLSLRSLSEGDNSVFSEGATTPVDPRAADKDQENASGNESEEVDDIELIFTTDESKDMSNLQEDLVSIRETDQWGPSSASTHSTPVLIKFHTLDPDFQPGGENKDNAENENQENSSLQGVIAESSLRNKRVSLPSDKEIRHVAFNGKGSLDLPGRGILKSYENKSDNMLYKKSPNTSTRRLDSIDSLTCEYNRGMSFDNTKSSSFELGSSMDILHREESVDSFHRTGHLGHRFSVFAETDISKCGISEDDLAVNLNVRRNTCPNPFQYRAGGYRVGARGPLRACAGVSGTPGAAGGAGRLVRPVLRDAAASRRSSAAQTDVCALPNRWSSDGYLAHKMSIVPGGMPTLPQRGAPPSGAGARRLTVPHARPPPLARGDDSRRVLLSDIGFTSMVPELSRSADPVWALGKLHGDSSPSSSTSKYLSRGSSCRSACASERCECGALAPPCHHLALYPEWRAWRSSLPDVRRAEPCLRDADWALRRSTDNLRYTSLDLGPICTCGCTAAYTRMEAGDAGSHAGTSTHAGTGIHAGTGTHAGPHAGSHAGVFLGAGGGRPYIPREPRHLRLGHVVKVIAPHGRLAIGRVRYVGLAGGTAAASSVVVGAEFPAQAGLPRNDGAHQGRRYFLTPPHHTALFVPFSKVVMAWAN